MRAEEASVLPSGVAVQGVPMSAKTYLVLTVVGAFLLFSVEPLIAKLMLPLFGGGAGVWSVCLVFFQSVLLLGYLYAHVLIRRCGPRAQTKIQDLSNKYLNLAPVVLAIAKSLNVQARVLDSGRDVGHAIYPATWVVLARVDDPSGPSFAPFPVAQPTVRFPVWTDDYSSVLRAFKW